MSELDTLDVDVYKTTRRPETFLLCRRGLRLMSGPDGLADVFHPAEHVMTLTLTPERPLAAQPADLVMNEIAKRGYFMQLPPKASHDRESTGGTSC
ncbi:MAG: hypothetical protein CM15mP84_03470 [Cellvibrionales bacterium]|nr:MAG: hypothetical protein CM15mP84_03470 [Cellvibrionales bacterium]